MKRAVRVMFVCVGLIALALGGASASATPPTPSGGTKWLPNQQVKFRWNEDSTPPSWARAGILAAAQDNNESRASQAAVLSQQDGATSWIGYTSNISSNYAIAYTVANQPDYFRIRIRPQGYVLDWGTLRWCQFYADPSNGCYDLAMVTLHEMGHVQSLGHPDESLVTDWLDTVMHEFPKPKAKAGWNQHEYGRCDVARLQIRYQALTTSTPYSTCLALPSALSLGASATSLTSGEAVTFSGQLKVAADAAYPSLAGQPASGRTVKLQRRAPGTSSWTTVSDMKALGGSGGYVTTLSPLGTYDWRAVFVPANEGLAPSTSNVIRVSVSQSCQTATLAGALIDPQAPVC